MGMGPYKIIPEGESHCVWMDAGLVSYKLCDKKLDCDACEFDRVIKARRQTSLEPAPSRAPHPPVHDSSANLCDEVTLQLLEPFNRAGLPGDRRYFSNHLWIKPTDDGQYRIGIDAFLGHLLHPLMGTVVLNAPAQLEKDSPFAWLLRDDETWSLHSMMAGTVTATNMMLTFKPSTLTTDPYGQGWIMTIAECRERNDASDGYTAQQFQPHLHDDIQRVAALLRSTLANQRQPIGASMFDGGMRVGTIAQCLGKKRYGELLSGFFRRPPR